MCKQHLNTLPVAASTVRVAKVRRLECDEIRIPALSQISLNNVLCLKDFGGGMRTGILAASPPIPRPTLLRRIADGSRRYVQRWIGTPPLKKVPERIEIGCLKRC
jgi:hypothetical protein